MAKSRSRRMLEQRVLARQARGPLMAPATTPAPQTTVDIPAQPGLNVPDVSAGGSAGAQEKPAVEKAAAPMGPTGAPGGAALPGPTVKPSAGAAVPKKRLFRPHGKPV